MNAAVQGQWSRDFARNFHISVFPGGYTAAVSHPAVRVTAKKLSEAGQGLRHLTMDEMVSLIGAHDRSDLLRSLADLLDSQQGPGAIAALAHQDVYESADLARVIDAAEQDGRLSHAEIQNIQALAARNALNGSELLARAKRLTPGEIDPED